MARAQTNTHAGKCTPTRHSPLPPLPPLEPPLPEPPLPEPPLPLRLALPPPLICVWGLGTPADWPTWPGTGPASMLPGTGSGPRTMGMPVGSLVARATRLEARWEVDTGLTAMARTTWRGGSRGRVACLEESVCMVCLCVERWLVCDVETKMGHGCTVGGLMEDLKCVRSRCKGATGVYRCTESVCDVRADGLGTWLC